MQVRCLLEGVPVSDILADWHGLLQHYMQTWQLDRSKVDGFVIPCCRILLAAVKDACHCAVYCGSRRGCTQFHHDRVAAQMKR